MVEERVGRKKDSYRNQNEEREEIGSSGTHILNDGINLVQIHYLP